MGYGTRQPPSTPLRPVGEQQAAVTPRRRTDKRPQAIFRPAAVDQSDSRFRRGHDVRETAGVLPAPGRLLRASITNAAPSVRTSRRGSVLAAASHKSSAAVSSSAAGSNTARYFTPGGTGTSASGAAKATATPHFFEQVGAVAGRKEGLPAVTLPGTSPGYCAIRCGTHALDTPWGDRQAHALQAPADSRTRPRYRRP